MIRNLILAGLIAVIFGAGVWALSRRPAPPATPPTATGEEHADHDQVRLTPDQIGRAELGLEVAGPAMIRDTLPLLGLITANAERTREVAARFPGTIRSVSRKLGDSVASGEALALVESNESLQSYPVTAPLAGVIITRNANPGEQTGDKVLFTIADLSTVWVELALFPRDIAKTHLGQPVRVQSTDGALIADGTIVYISPLSTAASQTRAARVLLDNRDQHWAPGLHVSADVTLGETSSPVAVKSTALQTFEGHTVVFVQKENVFEPRPVDLGRSDAVMTEIVGGLVAGDRYVAANSFILKAELGKGEAGHEH